MNKLKTLFAAAKAAPVKTTAIVTATTAVAVGTVYGVKKFRAYRAGMASYEDVTEAVKEGEEAVA